MWRVKNFILKTLFVLNAILFVYFSCCLDSESKIPGIGCIITLLYIVPFVLINQDKINDYWN